ncbi:MAG TPA: putative sulfate exporter family transporter [Thermoanaerobaculia bacterium]|nr:putative sulfate exporter family transporter [Thermoanaerobaculia bacterium]
MPPRFSRVFEAVPGLAASIAVMLAAEFVAKRLGAVVLSLEGLDPAGRSSPISGISMAIVLGLAVANTIGTAPVFRPGLQFAVRRMLRLGIILVGIRLSVFDVLKLGAWGLPVVAIIVSVALLASHAIARWLGVSDNLGTLAAASTAICGVTAALSVGPVIEAEEQETAYTVANVTLFGLVAMLSYPYLAHALFAGHPGPAGLFLGTGIHDTSQVMGAALSYKDLFRDDAAFRVATVTKLTRNVFLVAVVPLLAYLHARRTGHEGRRIRLAKLFPVFVLGFLAMAIVRSAGDAGIAAGGLAFGTWDSAGWLKITKTVGETWGAAALGIAMGGVGLSTNLRTFRAMGWRPLYVGGLAAILVALLALVLAVAVGPHLTPAA